MNAKRADLPADLGARRPELQRAILSVQRERVGLTEAFMGLAVECGAAEIETLILRLLRLQRAVGMAQRLWPCSGKLERNFPPTGNSRDQC
jgi:hypothetical protein